MTSAPIVDASATNASLTMLVALSSTAGVTVTSASLTSPSGQGVQLVGSQTQAQVDVPADGLASLSLAASVSNPSTNSAPVVALVLSDAALAGQPPAQPLPPLPPPSPPADAGVDNLGIIGVINTAYLAPYLLDPAKFTPQLSDNATVTVNGTYITVSAGYNNFSSVSGCSAATSAAYSEVVAASGGGWSVVAVTCRLNAPAAGSASQACGAASALLFDVSVYINSTGGAAVSSAAAALAATLVAPPSDGQGLGADCTLPPLLSSQVDVQETVDPSLASAAGLTAQGACLGSQARLQAELAASLSLQEQQLLYLPDPCTAYQVFPAPVPPFAPPDAPPAPGVRHPYSVWKSAVLGGVLGGVFLVQIIVLAVWIWHNRKEHRRAEAALALAYQTPHKYSAVEGHDR